METQLNNFIIKVRNKVNGKYKKLFILGPAIFSMIILALYFSVTYFLK